MASSEVGWRGLQVVNEADVEARLPEVVHVEPDGRVSYRQRYLGAFSTVMDLRDFPLDTQRLVVRFAIPGSSEEEFVFRCSEDRTGLTDEPSVADWRLTAVSSAARGLDIEVFESVLTGFDVSVDARRRLGFYIGKAFVSVAVIVLMSWAVFWLAPKHINPRVSVSVTSMLTLIAYRFLLGQELPKVGYLTRLDHFLLGSTALVFLALVEVTAAAWFDGRNRTSLTLRLDQHSRWLFPVAYVGLSAFAFLV